MGNIWDRTQWLVLSWSGSQALLYFLWHQFCQSPSIKFAIRCLEWKGSEVVRLCWDVPTSSERTWTLRARRHCYSAIVHCTNSKHHRGLKDRFPHFLLKLRLLPRSFAFRGQNLIRLWTNLITNLLLMSGQTSKLLLLFMLTFGVLAGKRLKSGDRDLIRNSVYLRTSRIGIVISMKMKMIIPTQKWKDLPRSLPGHGHA